MNYAQYRTRCPWSRQTKSLVPIKFCDVYSMELDIRQIIPEATDEQVQELVDYSIQVALHHFSLEQETVHPN